jgi:hypothetical protein
MCGLEEVNVYEYTMSKQRRPPPVWTPCRPPGRTRHRGGSLRRTRRPCQHRGVAAQVGFESRILKPDHRV